MLFNLDAANQIELAVGIAVQEIVRFVTLEPEFNPVSKHARAVVFPIGAVWRERHRVRI